MADASPDFGGASLADGRFHHNLAGPESTDQTSRDSKCGMKNSRIGRSGLSWVDLYVAQKLSDFRRLL
jgi:hypothetical protein